MRQLLILVCSLVLSGSATVQAQPVSQLHDALKLSQSQEAAWRTFQASAARNASRARAEQTATMLPTLPTPRRLAMIHAQMQADLADFDRSAQAVNAFYSALTPDQQRIFDEQTAGPPPEQQQQQRQQR